MIVLGVDSGTGSTKVLVVDSETGRVLGRGQAGHEMIPGLEPGEREQRPEMWTAAFEKALAEALRASSVDPSEVAALGISGQQHGFVPLDAAGRPIRPAKLWNDTSTIEETREITDRLGGPAGVIEKLGLGLAVGYTASKILWLKRHEPDRFDALAHILLPHDYLNFYLTGEYRMEFGDASGTGLLDIRTRLWRSEALNAIDPRLPGLLPVPAHPRNPAGTVRPSIARKFGFGRVLVASGGGDNMMAAIGTGNVSPGGATLSLGTSGTISCYADRPAVDAGGEIACFCDSTGGWLPLSCTLNAGNGEDAMRRLFRLDHAGLAAAAAEAPPGAEGIIYLPYLDGERVPILPEASGAFFGLTSRNLRPQNLARAVFEGICMNLRYGLRRLRSLGLATSELRATGGGSGNPIWLRIAADVLDTPISVSEEREAAAYGAAIQAIWNYGLDRSDKTGIAEIAGRLARREGPVIEPDPAAAAVYREAGARFDALTRSLGPEFPRHREYADNLPR